MAVNVGPHSLQISQRSNISASLRGMQGGRTWTCSLKVGGEFLLPVRSDVLEILVPAIDDPSFGN